MTAELIREARDRAIELRTAGHPTVGDLLQPGRTADADRLDRLADALERAEKERDEALRVAQPIQRERLEAMQNAALGEAEDELDRLRAENETMRGGLDRIFDQVTGKPPGVPPRGRLDLIFNIVRDALARTEPGTPLADSYSVTVRADGDILREDP